MPSDYRQRFYAEYVTTHYRSQGLVDPRTYTKTRSYFLRNYAALLPVKKDSAILDAGCGAGQFLNFLKLEGYTNLTGIDLSEAMLEIGRTVTHLQTLWQTDVESYFLANPENKFSCIVANDMAEHLTKTELLAFLDLCHSHLSPASGSLIILKVPNAASWFGARERYVDFTHELAFTPESVAQVLRVTGYTDVKVQPIVGSYLGGAKASIRSAMNLVFTQPLTKLVYTSMYGYGRIPLVLTPSMIAIGRRP